MIAQKRSKGGAPVACRVLPHAFAPRGWAVVDKNLEGGVGASVWSTSTGGGGDPGGPLQRAGCSLGSRCRWGGRQGFGLPLGLGPALYGLMGRGRGGYGAVRLLCWGHGPKGRARAAGWSCNVLALRTRGALGSMARKAPISWEGCYFGPCLGHHLLDEHRVIRQVRSLRFVRSSFALDLRLARSAGARAAW